jgi:hypothetical protein
LRKQHEARDRALEEFTTVKEGEGQFLVTLGVDLQRDVAD